MSYEDYTPPKEIRPGTRKLESYETCAVRGEQVMLKENARRKKPIKLSTMGTWIRHMKNEGVWKP